MGCDFTINKGLCFDKTDADNSDKILTKLIHAAIKLGSAGAEPAEPWIVLSKSNGWSL
jgi:hypothetical protein